MERLTDIEVIAGQVHLITKLELQNPSGLEKIVSRLQEIEDILGDTYDLDRLRELVEENKKSRARKCPKSGRMRLYPRIELKPDAAEPPRLDRSAWEPCRRCKTCQSCKSSICGLDDKSSECYDCDNMGNYEPMGFCPWCGRPLTDAAWEMLERSLAEKV